MGDFKKLYEKRKKELGYKGCQNCKNKVEKYKTCEWMAQGGDGDLHLFCPKWVKRKEGVVWSNRGAKKMMGRSDDDA